MANRVCSVLVVGLLAVLAACPSPNVYGTARTLPKGQSQHTFAFERFSTVGTPVNSSATAPPTYQYRYGVADHADIGVRIANASSFGVDVKWNLLRGETDVAVAPGFVGTYVRASDEEDSVALGLFHVQLPVLVGIRVNDSATLVISPGGGLAIATATATSGGAGRFVGASTPFARLGVGLNLRATPKFAIQPEVTAMKYSGSDGNLLTIGVGFSFGTQPRSSAEQRQLERDHERATRFANEAVAAAAQGDCKSTQRLSIRVKELDASVYRGLEVDPGAADCLAEADHARLAALQATFEACRQKRSEIARDASQITNLKERGRVFMSMPVCGAAPPPLRDLDGIRVRRSQAIATMTRTAADAARRGDCSIAKQLDPRVRELDAGLRDTAFARDPDVAKCFVTIVVPPEPVVAPVELVVIDPTVTVTDPQPAQEPPPAPAPDPPPTPEAPTPAPAPIPVPRVADVAPIPIPAPIRAEPAPPFPRRTAALAIGGAALAAGGVALWAGLDARSQRDAAREAGCNDDLTVCSTNGFAIAGEAHARGNLATGLLIGSGVAAAAAIVIWRTAPSNRANATAWRVAPTRGVGLALGKGF